MGELHTIQTNNKKENATTSTLQARQRGERTGRLHYHFAPKIEKD